MILRHMNALITFCEVSIFYIIIYSDKTFKNNCHFENIWEQLIPSVVLLSTNDCQSFPFNSHEIND